MIVNNNGYKMFEKNYSSVHKKNSYQVYECVIFDSAQTKRLFRFKLLIFGIEAINCPHV